MTWNIYGCGVTGGPFSVGRGRGRGRGMQSVDLSRKFGELDSGDMVWAMQVRDVGMSECRFGGCGGWVLPECLILDP